MKARPYLLLTLLLSLLSSNLFSADTPEVELDVRWFGQTRDEAWGEDYLGSSNTITLHSHGCALTAAAMVLDYYNIPTDPGVSTNGSLIITAMKTDGMTRTEITLVKSGSSGIFR